MRGGMSNVARMTEPRTMKSVSALPRRQELEQELANGAYWLRDERQHKASGLVGTYQIRLNIAEDQSLNGGLQAGGNEHADNLHFLVENLSANPDRDVACFLLRGSPTLQYWVFEDEADGTYLGSVVGHRSA